MGFSGQEYWSGLPFPSPPTLEGAEAKRKKEFNLEAWEKGDLKHNKLKKVLKSKKYCTNEGTN